MSALDSRPVCHVAVCAFAQSWVASGPKYPVDCIFPGETALLMRKHVRMHSFHPPLGLIPHRRRCRGAAAVCGAWATHIVYQRSASWCASRACPTVSISLASLRGSVEVSHNRNFPQKTESCAVSGPQTLTRPRSRILCSPV